MCACIARYAGEFPQQPETSNIRFTCVTLARVTCVTLAWVIVMTLRPRRDDAVHKSPHIATNA